jgi:uncharacterized membrane protein
VGASKVISSTLEEGLMGIIASGIAIGAVLVFAGLSWRLDSALMVTLLLSLLAVISAWHWLETPTLLWSSALALLGSGLLLAAQARSFRPTSGGVSAAEQMLPLAWLLFVVAIALAVAHVVAGSRAARSTRATLGFTAAMATIALLIPTAAHLQQDDWGNERASLAAPTLRLGSGEIQAARWLQSDVTGMPVILTAAGGGSGTIGSISALTGQPTVLGESEVQRRQRPGWEGLVESRRMDVATIYTQLSNWDTVAPLVQQYDVRYIIIGPTERALYGDQVEQSAGAAAANGHLERVYQHDGVAIYHVVDQPD